MQSTYYRYSPTAPALLEAPVFDVAGIMLQLIAQRASNNSYVTRANEISAWAGGYGQQNIQATTRALPDAWAWLSTSGFIAEEFKQAFEMTSRGEIVDVFGGLGGLSLGPSDLLFHVENRVRT